MYGLKPVPFSEGEFHGQTQSYQSGVGWARGAVGWHRRARVRMKLEPAGGVNGAVDCRAQAVFEGRVSGAAEPFSPAVGRAGAGVAVHYLLRLARGAGHGAGNGAWGPFYYAECG